MSDRPTGYYWIKYDWRPYGRRGGNHWEVASWDAAVDGWAMIGSRSVIPGAIEDQVFEEIGPRIIEPEL